MTKFYCLIAICIALFSVSCSKDTKGVDSKAVAKYQNNIPLPKDGASLPNDRRDLDLSHISDAQMKMVEATNRFGYSLFSNYAKEAQGQPITVISPYSIELCLTMFLAALDDQSYTKFTKAMNLENIGRDELLQFYSDLTSNMVKSDEKQRIFPANIAWISDVRKDYLPSYGETLGKYLGAEVGFIPFLPASEAVSTMNKWINLKTYGHIDKLIAPQDIENRSLVLCNAVYFYSPWNDEFLADNTKERPFRNADGSKVMVPTMNKATWTMRYCENNEVQIASLPLNNNQFSLLIVLPKSKDLSLDPSKLAEWNPIEKIGHSKTYDVEVFLPKLSTYSDKMDLGQPLMEMGFPADYVLSNLFTTQNHINNGFNVYQKTYVGWDEKGVEAAAASTVIPMPSDSNSNQEDVVLDVNRPFFFILMHEKSSKAVFIGAVNSFNK